MAATATQDDDLLIIDDSTDTDTDEIDFSFDFGDETETKTPVIEDAKMEALDNSETDSLDIGSSIAQEEQESQKQEVAQAEETLDFGIDLLEETDTQTKEVSHTPEPQTEEVSFDLGLTDEVSETSEISEIQESESFSGTTAIETSTGGGSTGDDTSMNEILSATIAKLATRKSNIATQKEEKLKHEDEIQSQIQELQNEHSRIEEELAGFDSESEKITKNIEELENMKLDPIKEHNAKRVAKKK